MIKKLWILGLILLFLVTTGCGSSGTETSKPKSEIESPRPAVEGKTERENRNSKQDPKVEADQKIQQFIRGITESNPEIIVYLMDAESRQYYGTERAQAAIADYKAIFGGSRIHYKLDSVERPQDHQMLEGIYKYLIYNDEGKKSTITFISSRDRVYIGSDIFLGYSWKAHNQLDGFIKALRNGNAKELAAALQEDDLHYPVSEAGKIISKYGEVFDLESINYKLTAITPDEQSFIYVVSGNKNGQHFEHQFKVICSDGLTGIRDEWFPSTQEVGTVGPG